MSNEEKLTLIQEMRQVEGMLAMARQYRPASIVKEAMDYILKMEKRLNELEPKDGVDEGEEQEEVSEAAGSTPSLD